MTSRHDRTKPQIIADACRDIAEVADAIAARSQRANADAKPPSHQRSQLGTRITGGGDPESLRTWADQTGETAIEVLAILEQVVVSTRDVRHQLYAIAASLEDWAPARQWDGGTRRCTVTDCARPHKARGLCETHYRREVRAEERERQEATDGR